MTTTKRTRRSSQRSHGTKRATDANSPKVVRVACYARKSVDKGHDEAFNSIDAQREAVEAYVKSQAGNGWVAIDARYDDLGFSGATTNRPAFQRLLADIDAGLVDVVAVYRLDRISRSQIDFLQLLDRLEQRGVTFCSITESFNTTKPMGRFALGLLMQVAQLERETTAERVRDKVIATRRRGMWTGGRPVLGFDVVNKQLVINADEADRVRWMFECYLKRRSLLAVVDELSERGWRSKTWTNAKDELVVGRPFDKHSLRRLLGNPLYAGLINADGDLVEGQHEAIVERATWDAVQDTLRENAGDKSRRRRKWRYSLQGLVECAKCGSTMGHHVTHRHGRKYAYMVCTRSQKLGARACPGSRVQAAWLEAEVLDRIREFGRDPELLAATVRAANDQLAERRTEAGKATKRLTRDRQRLMQEQARLVSTIGASDDAPVSLLDRLAEVESELADVTQRIETAKRETAEITDRTLDEEHLRETLADLDPVWDELVPRERARMLALLIERVVVDGAAKTLSIDFRPQS